MTKSTINKPSLKISVIIPSYNQGAFLEEAIQSIISQSYKNVELIIIDGGSTDETKSVIQKYSRHISFWESVPDDGQTHAINKGFAKATGDILGWLNSDDYYLPGYFEILANAFARDTSLDIVYANALNKDEMLKKVYVEYGRPVTIEFLRFGGIVLSHTAFWRKSVHQELDENLKCAMDYEFWMRLFPGRKWKHLNVFGAVFRIQPHSKTMNDRFAKAWEKDLEYVYKKHNLIRSSRYLNYKFQYINKFYRAYCSLFCKPPTSLIKF